MQSGVVNSYLQLLHEARSQGEASPRVHCFNTFFFSKLCGSHISALMGDQFDHLKHIDYMSVKRCVLDRCSALPALEASGLLTPRRHAYLCGSALDSILNATYFCVLIGPA